MTNVHQKTKRALSLILVGIALSPRHVTAATRVEHFDRQPPNWEGVNNHSTNFEPKTVSQNFGYSPQTSHAGDQPGEVGGTINPAGEPAFYGFRLPVPLTFEQPCSASGKLFVPPGPGHCLLGFFNARTLSGWR